jgi:hypothetical protein
MSKAAELAALIGSQSALSNRNLIINGAMQVAQRGTSASGVHPNYVSLDRYMTNVSGGGAFTLSQETDTPSGQGFKNSMKVTVDTADGSIAAGDFYLIQQRIEGQNVAQLMLGTANATKVTLSFWVKSSLTGNFGGSFVNGAGDRSYPFQYNISSANTWQKITETVQLDTSGTWATDNTTGLKILFDFGSGTTYQGTADTWASANYHTASSSVQLIGTGSATWYITGLQLELGEQATAFEHRSFADELIRCQRYFERSYQIGTATGAATASGAKMFQMASSATALYPSQQNFITVKRAAPTMVAYSTSSGTADRIRDASAGQNLTVSSISNTSATSTGNVNISSSSTSGRQYLYHWTADAEL